MAAGSPAQRVVLPDAEYVATEVAGRLLALLESVQADGRMPQVGLTGGTIADAIHAEVARRAPDSSVDWSRVVVWWGDERFVPAGSDDRNARQARRTLLDALPLDPAHVHEVPAADQVDTAEAAAAAYSSALREHGAGRFDVLMLGLGPDGHVASLFPGHEALGVDDEVAVAVHDSPKPPPDRVTLTFPALARSAAVWLVVSGEGKADAVAAAWDASSRSAGGSPSPAQVAECPARGVAGQDETVWFLDEAAASHL
jgi:6-phosphogluconolactonase